MFDGTPAKPAGGRATRQMRKSATATLPPADTIPAAKRGGKRAKNPVRKSAMQALPLPNTIPVETSGGERAKHAERIGASNVLPLANTIGKRATNRLRNKVAKPEVPLSDPTPPATEGGERAIPKMCESTTQNSPLADICASIREQQRRRRFAIVSQSRCDRSCEAFLARAIGFRNELPEKERAAIWKQVSAFRREVEKAGEGQTMIAGSGHKVVALTGFTDIVHASAQSRRAWDVLRKNAEAEMRRLAALCPGYRWSQAVAGFGALGFGIIVGEAGNLSDYSTHDKLWKRLGLALVGDERQQRKSGAEAAAAHGFNPKRRAEIWAIADSMFKHQWRGEKDGMPAHAIGRYGEVYAHRKEATRGRNSMTLKHKDNDARRVMSKALVRHMWVEWKREVA